jgi:hypothetical protein
MNENILYCLYVSIEVLSSSRHNIAEVGIKHQLINQSINLVNTEGAIKNGQSRETGNILKLAEIDISHGRQIH